MTTGCHDTKGQMCCFIMDAESNPWHREMLTWDILCDTQKHKLRQTDTHTHTHAHSIWKLVARRKTYSRGEMHGPFRGQCLSGPTGNHIITEAINKAIHSSLFYRIERYNDVNRIEHNCPLNHNLHSLSFCRIVCVASLLVMLSHPVGLAWDKY